LKRGKEDTNKRPLGYLQRKREIHTDRISEKLIPPAPKGEKKKIERGKKKKERDESFDTHDAPGPV